MGREWEWNDLGLRCISEALVGDKLLEYAFWISSKEVDDAITKAGKLCVASIGGDEQLRLWDGLLAGVGIGLVSFHPLPH